MEIQNLDSSTNSNVITGSAPASGASVRKHIGLRAYIGTFGTSVIVQCFTVLQGIIIARLLGPLGRGQYAAVLLWPNIFAAIGIFGTNIALARAAAKTEHYAQVIRTAVFLALITALPSSLACYLLLPYLFPQAEQQLLGLSRLFVIFIILNHLALNLVAVDQGAGNFKRFNFTRALLYPVYVAFLLGMWVSGIREVRWAAIGLLAANFAVAVVRLGLAVKDMKLWGRLYSPIRAVKESIRFGLVGAAMPLYQQADKAILLWLLGAENLGLYVVALSASAAIGSITNSAGMVSFTAAAQAQQGEGFEKIAKTFRLSALLWLFFGGILAIAMSLLLPLVYGGEFASAVNPARLLIVGSAFAGLANLLDQALRGQGRALVGFEGRVVGLVVMLAAGVVLTTWSGLSGMCLAYDLGQGTCLLFFAWRISSHYGQPAEALRSLIVQWGDIQNLLVRIRGMLPGAVAR
jgi:antigen flippase